MKIALKRSGDTRLASEANTVFQPRTKAWDHMTGTQINAIDGSDQVPITPIRSGAEAAEFLASFSRGGHVPVEDFPRCNCHARLRRTTNPDRDVRMPEVTANGVCVSCGVLR